VRESFLKSIDKSQFFRNCLKNVPFALCFGEFFLLASLKIWRKKLYKLAKLDTKLYELFKNRLIILQNFI